MHSQVLLSSIHDFFNKIVAHFQTELEIFFSWAIVVYQFGRS